MKIQLLQGDFREKINEIDYLVDMVITDPPYNIGFKYNEYKDNLSDEDYIDMLSELQNMPLAIIHYPEETMKYIVPAIGVPDEVLVWAYNSNISRQSRLINIYQSKVNFNAVKQPYKNPTDKRIAKRIKDGHIGGKSYDWFSDIQLVKNVSKDKFNHPCPIPVKLMERIILLTTKPGDTVLDPFMGVGTTGIACRNTGRNFIGIELDEEYFKIAEERCSK